MALDVQVLSASQIIEFGEADILCDGGKVFIESAEGTNVYRVYYPEGSDSPSVSVSKGALQFIESGKESKTTYPQFSGETNLPEGTVAYYAVGDSPVYYYGVRAEVSSHSYDEYVFIGPVDEGGIPAFAIAASALTIGETDRKCIAIAISQVSATGPDCGGALSIERADATNVYRIWYPVGSSAPSYQVSQGGLIPIGSGTEVRVTYPVFSGLEQLPTDGPVLVQTALTVNRVTLYYGVQEKSESFSYVDVEYFGPIEPTVPDFMIAYMVYKDEKTGVPCPVFASSQVSMSGVSCSTNISIEAGEEDSVYRVWYPVEGSAPSVKVTIGSATQVGSGSESRVTYPQFSGVEALPPSSLVNFSRSGDNGKTLYYGVEEKSETLNFTDYRIDDLPLGDRQPPVFFAAFGVYTDKDTGGRCVAFAASQVSSRRSLVCDKKNISITRGEGINLYRVRYPSGSPAPTVLVYGGNIEPKSSGSESIVSFPTFSGEDIRPSNAIVSLLLAGKHYGIREVTESYTYDEYLFRGSVHGSDTPGFIVAYSVDGSLEGHESCVYFASTQAEMELDLECQGRISIERSDARNQYVVAYEDTGQEPSVSISKGSMVKGGLTTSRTREAIRTYSGERERPTNGTILLDTVINDKHYGVLSENITESVVVYEYHPPAAELDSLCLEDDDPAQADAIEVVPAHMIAWSSYLLPGATDPCVSFATSSITYDCSDGLRCDSPLSLSISAGEAKNTMVVTYPGGRGTPKFVALNGSIGAVVGSTEETTESISQFANLVEPPPGEVLVDVVIEDRHYGFISEEITLVATTYEVDKANSESLSEDVIVYGFLVDGACHALASASIPVVLSYALASRRQTSDNGCWVELEHKDSELLYVRHGVIPTGQGRLTLEAVNATLVYRGQESTNASNIVEFAGLEEVPAGAIFHYSLPNFDRVTQSDPAELYYGFRQVSERIESDVYAIRPNDLRGRDTMYVYAYLGRSVSCNAYAQIVIPPPYEEPQYEEYEAYRVASRILITDEGAFAAPGPDKDAQIKEALEDAGVEPYLITEIVHEQGYINQLWNRRWARPESHDHPTHPTAPYFGAIAGAGEVDLYIKWSPPSFFGGNFDVVPGGRHIVFVYGDLDSKGAVPTGVSRRWGTVRVLPE